MAPITREQALENALASSRIEGYEVTEQTRADCRRLMDGKVDARTLAAEILARRRAGYPAAFGKHIRLLPTLSAVIFCSASLRM